MSPSLTITTDDSKIVGVIGKKIQGFVDRQTACNTGIRVSNVERSNSFIYDLPHFANDSSSQLYTFKPLCFDDDYKFDPYHFFLGRRMVSAKERALRDQVFAAGIRAFARQLPLGRTVDLSCRPCDETIAVEWDLPPKNSSEFESFLKKLAAFMRDNSSGNVSKEPLPVISPPQRTWSRLQWTADDPLDVFMATNDASVL